MKKSRPLSFVLLAALLTGLLACNLPIDLPGFQKEQIVNITEVIIDPPSSSGDFTLTMSYSHLSQKPVTISCYYVTPDKNTYAILVIDDDGKTPAGSITRTRAFTVVKSGGEAAEGVYTATCTDENGISQKWATFTVGADANADVAILDMAVTSGAGGGYQLTMAYVLNIPDAVSFSCFYNSPDGASMPIGNFTDDQHLKGTPVTKVLYFSISAADLKANPGTNLYTATCQEDENRASKTVNFTVSGESATATPEPAREEKTIFGKFSFDGAHAVTNPAGLGGLVDEAIRYCIPTVKIFPNGTLEGLCEYQGATDVYTNVSIRAKVTGKVRDARKFDFTFEVEMHNPNGWKLTDVSDVSIWAEEWKYAVTIRGSGTFTDTYSSNGVADFDYSCDTGASNLMWCWKSQSKTVFSGTIPWMFTPEK